MQIIRKNTYTLIVLIKCNRRMLQLFKLHSALRYVLRMTVQFTLEALVVIFK